ncbi:hypothetical protein PKF032_03340 [Polynucleobacter yangtzensis]|uniref:Lysylphosphatidylglycerol synthase TM region n=2 Tax=Polynucleobacter yangtzensis TaxID=1743159 RepID=A0ABM8CKS0_9BURK|nr:hypothetical protein PKF032_03340 [Polynucleobacter yangtzensis]
MLNKKIVFKISNILIIFAAVAYVVTHYRGRDESLHFLLFFSISSLIYSIRVLLHAFLYKVLYIRYTSSFYSVPDWLKFFSISQLYGAFIPGSAFAMRAYAIRDRYSVSFKKSIIVYGAFYLSSIAIFLVMMAIYLCIYSDNFFCKYFFQDNLGFGAVFIVMTSSLLVFILYRIYKNKFIKHLNIFTKKILLVSLFIQGLSFIFTYLSFYVLFNAVNLQVNLIDTFNTFIALQTLVYIPQLIPGNIGIQEAFLAIAGGSYTMSVDALFLYSSTIRLLTLIGSLIVYLFCALFEKITTHL